MVAIALLACNFSYFTISVNSYDKIYSLISEALLYVFSITCFFSIVYYFARSQSPQLLITVFFLSLIPVSFFIGWIDAKLDIESFSSEAKSKILLNSDKIVSAKILRSFEKGILIMTENSNSINFISWDQIKEAKFKKVSSF